MIQDNSKTITLLSEIVHLLKKYGTETFKELALVLTDPTMSQDIAKILSSIAEHVPKSSEKSRSTSASERHEKLGRILLEVRQEDPEKGTLLLSCYDMLKSKTTLATVKKLSSFISDHGFDVPKSQSRDLLVISLIEKCLPLSNQQLKKLLDDLLYAGKTEDRTLASWGNIILPQTENMKYTSLGDVPERYGTKE